VETIVTFTDNDHLGEFDVIRKFFWREALTHPSPGKSTGTKSPVMLGIGDDCALLDTLANDEVLAITTDMLVEGRHFFKDANPRLLGHKCLAVNLSDLAAMGARPIAYTLSLALPSIQTHWLEEFSSGLHALSDAYQCPLIGGDTTAGPLTISITAFGGVPRHGSLRRSAAQLGDDIWVSNTLGDARLILGFRRGEWQFDLPWQSATSRMDAPIPRISLGQNLIGLAHAAIDVSDGLLGDLGHILQASGMGAEIWVDSVPHSALLSDVSLELRRLCTLRGGDDYELCFTAPTRARAAIEELGKRLELSLTRIGVVKLRDKEDRMTLLDHERHPLPRALAEQYIQSFDHFQGPL
jgi:thiamine-monophosphate kinase